MYCYILAMRDFIGFPWLSKLLHQPIKLQDLQTWVYALGSTVRLTFREENRESVISWEYWYLERVIILLSYCGQKQALTNPESWFAPLMSSSCTLTSISLIFLSLSLLPPPPPPLFMLSAPTLSALTEDLGWLLLLMAVRREWKRRDGEGRWRGATGEMTGCCLSPRTNFGFRVFRCSHQCSCEMDERQRCWSEMEN